MVDTFKPAKDDIGKLLNVNGRKALVTTYPHYDALVIVAYRCEMSGKNAIEITFFGDRDSPLERAIGTDPAVEEWESRSGVFLYGNAPLLSSREAYTQIDAKLKEAGL